MVDYSCKLIKTVHSIDTVGNDIETKQYIEIPIMRIEDVYADEFYRASQNGFKPSLRIKTSALNYNNEPMLEYMGNEYDIIRVDNARIDEVYLICERRIGND